MSWTRKTYYKKSQKRHSWGNHSQLFNAKVETFLQRRAEKSTFCRRADIFVYIRHRTLGIHLDSYRPLPEAECPLFWLPWENQQVSCWLTQTNFSLTNWLGDPHSRVDFGSAHTSSTGSNDSSSHFTDLQITLSLLMGFHIEEQKVWKKDWETGLFEQRPFLTGETWPGLNLKLEDLGK